jgi:DNA-binding transcriptional LysR family regulator
MNLDDLTYFLAMAETGRLSRASALVGVSQPALTKALRRIEAELGVPLFERTSKGLQLTEFGSEFRKGAEQIRLTYTETLTGVGEMRAGGAALVNIGVTPATEALAARAFLEVVKGRPALRLKLKTALSDALLRDLETGALDVVIAPIPAVLAPGLRAELIADEKGWIACRRGHRLSQLERPATASDLAREHWVLPALPLLARQQIEAFFAADGIKGPQVQIETNYGSTIALFTLVSNSDLLSLCSAQLRVMAESFGICEVPLANAELTRKIGIITRAHGTLSPLTKTFCAAIADTATDTHAKATALRPERTR